MAKHEVANRKTVSLLHLLQFSGLREIKCFGHQSQRSIREIVITLRETVATRVCSKVQHARAHDELTGIKILKGACLWTPLGGALLALH